MSDIAIRVSNLSKLYHIGAKQRRHDTLRDMIASKFGRNGTEDAAPAGRQGRRETDGTGLIKSVLGRLSPVASPHEDLWALKDVSFEVKRGEVVGIIGRNGAGKSTLLKILSRITKPTTGSVEMHGRIASLLEVGTGFHPELTGRENIYLNGAILGMKRVEIDRKFDEIVAFSEVEKFLDTPVKRYSSGMYVRLAFAVAAHLEPDILVVDEVLAVGDWEFQKKCLGKMEEVAGAGRTVLFVSHNMDAINSLCRRAILLESGRIKNDDSAAQVVRQYMGFAGYASSKTLGLRSEVIDIEEICLRTESRELKYGFSWNESFMIEIKYDVHQSRNWLSIGLVISSANGEPVLTTVSRGAEDNKVLQNGKGLSRVKIPKQFLSPGEYSIFVNAHSIYDLYCVTHNAISFRIEDEGREILGREGQMKWPGVVSPLLHWTNVPIEEHEMNNA